MAIFDNNSTVKSETLKLYDNDATTRYETKEVYDNDHTTKYLIWKSEQMLFSGVKVGEISTNRGTPYQSNSAETQKYGLNYSDWNNIKLTGSYNLQINGQGSYTVENKAELRGTINGQDELIATINSSSDNGGKTFNINKNINISSYKGNGNLYLYIWIRNSNTGETSGGRLSLENMTCILS